MPRTQPGPPGAPRLLAELPVLKSARGARKLWRSLDYSQHDELARVFAASIVEQLPVVSLQPTETTTSYAWEQLSMHCSIGQDAEAAIFTLRWYLDGYGGRPPHDLTTGWLVKNAAEGAVRAGDAGAGAWILDLMDELRPFVDSLDHLDNLRDHYPTWHDRLGTLVGR